MTCQVNLNTHVMEIIDFVIDNGISITKSNVIGFAVNYCSNDYIKPPTVIKYLIEKGCKFTNEHFYSLMRYRQYYISKLHSLNSDFFDCILDHIEITVEMMNHTFDCTKYRFSQYQILKMYEKSGLKITEEQTMMAATVGHTKLLLNALDQHIPWKKEFGEYIVFHKDSSALEKCYDKCYETVTSQGGVFWDINIYNIGIKRNSLQCVQFEHKKECPLDDTIFDITSQNRTSIYVEKYMMEGDVADNVCMMAEF